MSRLILQGVVGSTAYGLTTPDSDIDLLGIHLGPIYDHVTFGFTKSQQTVVTEKPDSTSHEVGKFLNLILGGNPTVTELLFLDEYRTQALEAEWLLSERKSFLGARAVRDSYGGYAMQQLKRLLSRGDGSFSSDTRKRTQKHARHCLRLLIQGTHVLTTGTVMIALPDDLKNVVMTASELAGEGRLVTLENLYSYWNDRLLSAYRQTSLPEEPDRAVAKDVLYEIRRHQWRNYER